jgi:acyl-CoA synthetase (NDP forming)
VRTGTDLSVAAALASARDVGRERLLESEGLLLARVLGLAVPRHELVADGMDAAVLDLTSFPGEQLVVKVCSPEVPHKAREGGVAVIPKDIDALVSAVDAMTERFAHRELAGVLVCEHVPHATDLGGELLLGLRWTDDFGPVVTLGPGGAHAELLAGALRPDRGPAILSPELMSREVLTRALEGRAVTAALAATTADGAAHEAEALASAAPGVASGEPADTRASLPAAVDERVLDIALRALQFAEQHMPHDLLELEFNPVAVTDRGLVALDALGRVGTGAPTCSALPRPLHQLGNLLRPETLAIQGVSERRNPGRIILENVLGMGFPAEGITLIKPGRDELLGCRCVPDVAALDGPVDLLVVALAAQQVPDVMAQVTARRAARSVILIPGGMGEREGSEGTAEQVRATLASARAKGGGGPLVNGGNCLGVRSLPGRYDTLFIPRHKLRFRAEAPAPLALISQSGAFAVARSSGLASLDPRYVVTVGNQIDLTVGDWLTGLKDDRELDVFACYVEGFAPLDGRRALQACAEITASGRAVIVYRAGRTPAGAKASASHTASIAGDWAVSRELLTQAGALVVDSLDDFEDLVRLFVLLGSRRPTGLGLGAVSNAGFESVAMADHAGPFSLPEFAHETTASLEALLEDAHLSSIVGVANPLDVTPILGDEGFARAASAVLADPAVDVGLVGCVPMSGALDSVPAGADHDGDVARPGSVANRLADLFAESSKPWVAVIDGGPLYDPMVRLLEARGVPTFRRADRALRLLASWTEARLRAG